MEPLLVLFPVFEGTPSPPVLTIKQHYDLKNATDLWGLEGALATSLAVNSGLLLTATALADTCFAGESSFSSPVRIGSMVNYSSTRTCFAI